MSDAVPPPDADALDAFADLVAANRAFASGARPAASGVATAGLAIITCMDARIDPLAALGLTVGDAVVLRGPGGRVTDETVAALTVASHLLGVDRVLVVPHTDCRMAKGDADALHAAIHERSGVDTRAMAFVTATDQRAALADDLLRLRSAPTLPPGLRVGGALLDLATGLLERIDA